MLKAFVNALNGPLNLLHPLTHEVWEVTFLVLMSTTNRQTDKKTAKNNTAAKRGGDNDGRIEMSEEVSSKD